MLKVKKPTLLLSAGVVWLAAGINILRIDITALVACFKATSGWLPYLLIGKGKERKILKIRKSIWLTVALIAFGLGTTGIVLPILPTVPLYLLAAFGFANSSDRLHTRFLNSRLYQRYLLPYRQAGGLPLKGKIPLIVWVTIQIGITAFLVRQYLFWVVFLLLLYAGFLFSMLFVVKTVPSQSKPRSSVKSRPLSHDKYLDL